MIRIRTPYDRAEKAGKEILKKAKEEHIKRQEYGKKETYQAAKEAATYLVNQAKGKIMVFGSSSYCCFDCKNRLSPCCGKCSNGTYFHRKGAA